MKFVGLLKIFHALSSTLVKKQRLVASAFLQSVDMGNDMKRSYFKNTSPSFDSGSSLVSKSREIKTVVCL